MTWHGLLVTYTTVHIVGIRREILLNSTQFNSVQHHDHHVQLNSIPHHHYCHYFNCRVPNTMALIPPPDASCPDPNTTFTAVQLHAKEHGYAVFKYSTKPSRVVFCP
jgi:hypothetical protein